MPRFSSVHYQSLEAVSALAKLTRDITKRRRTSAPAPGEYPLNVHNLRRCLEAVQASLEALREEHTTLDQENATTPVEPLAQASAHLAAAIAALPTDMPVL